MEFFWLESTLTLKYSFLYITWDWIVGIDEFLVKQKECNISVCLIKKEKVIYCSGEYREYRGQWLYVL